ncbi:MAG: isopeptide-forming domain-containing fimbrial protein [Deferrisomatales bacterium]|nr:isopeptide-forming domain-containing fimbrial protein [Deferrisomatales bacterium]
MQGFVPQLWTKLIRAAFGPLALLLGAAAPALAVNCSDAPYFGVIDGNFVSAPSQIQIDTNCTIRNFPSPNILSTNFSFYTQPGGTDERWLVVFDNVVHTGNMACNAVAGHRIWFTNGSSTKIQEGCQNLLIPVEKIDKQDPPGQPTATIGVPFTYKLTIPVLYDPALGVIMNSSGSPNTLHGITVWDDLNATGADLAYVGHVAYWQGAGTPLAHTFSNDGGLLTFEFPGDLVVPAGGQIIIEITVVLRDTPANTAGTQFVNTAKWEFGRLIDDIFYQPLPGEWGVSEPMTIAEPNLVVTKTSSETALNIGVMAPFTVDVQNTGGSDAWNVTILDLLPGGGDAGMCDYDPRTINPPAEPGVSARIVAADGTLVRQLSAGTDYTLGYAGPPACQLRLTMTGAAGPIAPEQHLIITYQSQLDAGTTADGIELTNVAGATEWWSGDGSHTGLRTYSKTLSDGTPSILDHQDSYTITTALSGYYFQKTVENLTSHANPAFTAAPGDRLRYRLRLFNVDQTINDIAIDDPLDLNSFLPDTFAMGTLPAGAAYSFEPGTGLLQIRGDTAPLGVAAGEELVFEFEITLRSTLTNGTVVLNQASLSAADAISALSDDPYVNGIAPPGEPADPTRVLIQTPGPLAKATTQPSATIGEQFAYRIAVPATPIAQPLYDVRILDDLSRSAADLRFVSAGVVSGGPWTPTNTSGSDTQLVLEDLVTGIDIPPNGQVVIEITVELLNTSTNRSGLLFTNTASYTYNRANGDDNTRMFGGEGSAAPMTVVEPAVAAATKTARFVTPAGKAATDPATFGDVLEYVVTLPNSGGSTAFDVTVTDRLPANVTLVAGSATARINGVEVGGFEANPTTLPGGALAWGQENGDGSLDIPAGQSLVLTYQVTVDSVTGPYISNSVYADWTSLQGASMVERTGEGCPTITAPDTYCYGPVVATVDTVDNTSISKAVLTDSYAESPASTTDPVVRVGDTVTYQLTLSLQENTTRSVVVEDALPAGMVLDSFSIDAAPGFSYTLAAQPAAGATGTLRWEFGDIFNQPSNDGTPIDPLAVRYVARVLTEAPPAGIGYEASTLLDNVAKLAYAGGDPAVHPVRLTATERIDVRQPRMQTISKVDLGSGRLGTGTAADPYQVNIATDVMSFRLSSCNDGLGPAYGVVMTDLLAPEFDESYLAAPPVVRVGTTPLAAGSDYTYAAPGRGGEMRIALLDDVPVDPGQCVTVDYELGFRTDLDSQTIWSNQARLHEYWSLPTDGRLYAPVGPAQVWMTNVVRHQPLAKTLVSPAAPAPGTPAEATIGEEVDYQILVPAAPVNASMDGVVVTDTLHGALEYVGSAATLNGAPLAVTPTQSGQTLGWTLGTIPAGQQATITLRTRVANNEQANAGTSFANTASYTYSGIPDGAVTASSSGLLAIVEPLVTVSTSASTTSPRAGEVLTYTVSFTAAGGGAGDSFSSAFDLTVENTLGLGLLYVPGSATLNGAALADPETNGADGIGAAQTLVWEPANGIGIDIDIAEGTTATLTYQARVLDSVAPGQTLTNSVVGRWTGLDGVNDFERNGSGTPAVNDYFTEPAELTLTTPLAVSLAKSVVNATTEQDPGANAAPGDTLRFTLVLVNESIVSVNDISVVDELAAQFAPGTLQVLSAAGNSFSNVAGGVHGTGMVDIRNLTLGAAGEANDSLTIEFEATLAPVIRSGTSVPNRARLTADNLLLALSNETSTLISSAPQLRVLKTSQYLDGDPSVLMAGEALRYTITVKNIGTEDAVGVSLRDQVPANTTYVAGSTTLNGAPVADAGPGVSPLQNGMPIHAPEDPTPGNLRADASDTLANVATVTFDVVVSPHLADGAIISNQGFVSGSGEGSGVFSERPSDDPDTDLVDDPTRDVVGNLPLVYATKTVQIVAEAPGGTVGVVDPGDVLRYTITLTNSAATPAAGVTLTDAVPPHTTYVPDSLFLNGLPVGQPDGGISPLVAGIPVSSRDLTPPLPGADAGTLSPNGGTATVTFDVQVNAGTESGTVIRNQATVGTSQLPPLPTDADGIPGNGYQPTEVVVGDAQMLVITKEVSVVGGGPAQAGGQLEYVLRVTNISTVPATRVVIADDLGHLGPDPYVAGSATVDGLFGSVAYDAPILSVAYGDLPPGGTTVVRFRVRIDPALPFGTTITNTGVVTWNDPAQSASASVSVEVGGTPGSGTVGGRVWHDGNLDKVRDGDERALEGWSVELHRGSRVLATVFTDAEGLWRIGGLLSNDAAGEPYDVRFRAAGAGPNTAHLGYADSPFTNGSQRILGVTVPSGSNLQNLNLPITPNGTVYDSVRRTPVRGARLALVSAASGAPLPSSCFDDPAQQNQVTPADGFYKFDLNFSEPSCPPGGDFLIAVTPPANGYDTYPSRVIPPASDATTSSFSVPACPGTTADAVPATTEYCEATTSALPPPLSVGPRTAGTTYYLNLTLSNGSIPGQSQIFNNPVPIDPVLDGAASITKTAAKLNVSRGDLVPYTITVRNLFGAPLTDLSIVDRFPAGFKYVESSARLDGTPSEPVINGQTLTWDGFTLETNQTRTLQLLLVVGAGVAEAEYVNRAQVLNGITGGRVTEEATATVRVVPDPTFDCTDVIGKVFDDRNRNGRQDDGEPGLSGVRVVTARGLIANTDPYGRFHIACAAVPDRERGSNFILKVDDRTLPSGYRLTTENPRVQRATRGKMLRFQFGATIHRVVTLDVADAAYEPGTTDLRLQWQGKLDQLLGVLEESPSVLRLSYLADVESERLVRRRLHALKKEISGRWERVGRGDRLDIETEVFWRRGSPP